jgi:uncharacterized repeat protein (TIGR01451 family)/fimbrial isopeptide formation D2 family protein
VSRLKISPIVAEYAKVPTTKKLTTSLATAIVLAIALIVPATAAASAEGPPNITLEKHAPAQALLGTKQKVELVAGNPIGEPRGYNLSFRDVLPKGVEYVAGSGSLAPLVLKEEPNPGETTLLFENTSDLSANSKYAITYEVEPSTTFFKLNEGHTYINKAEDFVSLKPRRKPKFLVNGEVEAGSYKGKNEAEAATELTAIEITKSEPSPEGEILRGLHEHQVVYTLTVKNNAVIPTSGIEVEDWVPAGLEFLGCGNVDNTTETKTNPGSAEEYPGSGAIDAKGNLPTEKGFDQANCELKEEPASVETVETIPPNREAELHEKQTPEVFTHVTWKGLGNLAPGAELKLYYVAAIPILRNSLEWLSPEPTPASLGQTANLGNNTGAETHDEEPLINTAQAKGSVEVQNKEGETEKVEVKDTETIVRTAEDLAIQKSASQGEIYDGAETTWTLNLETSEYRWDEPVSITDQLPNGLCPIGPQNYEGGPGAPTQPTKECAASTTRHPMLTYVKGGPNLPPEQIEYSHVEEEEEGGFKVEFDDSNIPALKHLEPSQELSITFPTNARTFYQHDFENANPILTGDSWTNNVSTVGQAFNRCFTEPKTGEFVADPNCEEPSTNRIYPHVATGIKVEDVSSAKQSAGGIEIEKSVRENVGPVPVECTDPSADYVKGLIYENETALPKYRPGDEICWRLVVKFASALYAGHPIVSDFIPAGEEYVEESEVEGPENTITATFNEAAAKEEQALEWAVGKPEAESVEAKQRFEYRFKTRMLAEPTFEPGEISGNLMKFVYSNTEGETFPLRDRSEIEREEPELKLTKAVTAVNGEPASGSPTVHGGDKVTYSLGLTNSGNLEAIGTEVWDVLPKGVDCETEVEAISAGGACAGTTKIVWTGINVKTKAEVEAGAPAPTPLTYVMAVPTDVAPGHVFTNNSGVTHYESATNTETPFRYVPEANISKAEEEAHKPNTGEIKAPASVTTSGAGLTKTYETLGGPNPTQATIGQLVEYTVTATVPHGSTIYGTEAHPNSVVTDPLPAGLKLISATATLNGGPLSASGLELATSGNKAEVVFPPTFANTGAENAVVLLKIVARVENVVGNKRGVGLLNVATFSFAEKAGGAEQNLTGTTTTPIYEPHLVLAKTTPTSKVAPGESVKYTITVSNPEEGAFKNVSTAYDVVVKDPVPAGMKVVSAGTGTQVGSEIEWKLAEVKPGKAVKLEYTLEVEKPAKVASVFVNKAVATTQSLPDEPGEVLPPETRTTGSGYKAEAEKTVSLIGATVEKSVAQPTGTIGQQLEYTLTMKLPPNIKYFNSTVVDTLPPGVAYDETISAKCTAGCPGVEGEPLPPKASTTTPGATYVGWYFGNEFGAISEERVLTVKFKGHIKQELTPGSKVVAEAKLQNSVVGVYNATEKAKPTETPTPGSSGFTQQTAPATATTTVVEPGIELTKSVSGDSAGIVTPGQPLTYTLTVKNNGKAKAFETEVTDSNTTKNLREITPVAGAEFLPSGWEAGDPLVWTIPVMKEGETVTLTYTAELLAGNELEPNEEVKNLASVPTYFGLSKTEREAAKEFRTYEAAPKEADLNVELPTLKIEKTTGVPGHAEGAEADVGQAFPWRLVVSNTATYAGFKEVVVEDQLPENWTYLTANSTVGGSPQTATESPVGSGHLSWTLPALPAKGSVEILFEAEPQAKAAEVPGLGTTVNEATAHGKDDSGAEEDAAGKHYVDADTATADLVAPKLTVEKTQVGPKAVAGDVLEYRIDVKNSGDGAALGPIRVEDILSAGQTFVEPESGSLPTGVNFVSKEALSEGRTKVIWTVEAAPPATAALAVGASVTIPVAVKIPSTTVEGESIKDEATVSSPQTTETPRSEVSTTVEREADLKIKKEADRENIKGGENIDYTLTAENLGPSEATEVKVTDELPEGTTFVRDEGEAGRTCSFVAPTVTCAVGNLAVGGQAVFHIEVKVTPALEEEGKTDVVNTAEIAGKQTDPHLENNSATVTTPIGGLADVSIVKTGPTTPVLLGNTFTYKLEVANAGPSNATAVEVTDQLPAEVEYLSAEAPTGTTCAEAGGKLTCELGTLPVGGAPVVIEVTVKAIALPAPGTEVANTAEAHSPTADPDEGNNKSEVETEVVPAADLAITKTAPATVEPNGELTYKLHVEDKGPSTAHKVAVTDPLPAGTEFVSASEGCSAAGTIVTCEVAGGELEVGGEGATFQVTVHVPFALGGAPLTNTATVSAEESDPHPEDNSSTVTTMVGPDADLAITKTMGKAEAGKPLVYTLAITNHGPSASSAVTVKDTLPAGTTFKSAAPSQGTCSANGQAVTCELGALASGGSAQVSITVEVSATATGTLRNVASVEGPEPDPDKSNNESAVEGPITPVPAVPTGTPNLKVVKTADTSTPQVGVPFDYDVAVSNSGDAEAKDVTVVDTLNGPVKVVSFQTGPYKCAAAGSKIECTIPSVPIGKTVHITYSVVAESAGPLSNTASAEAANGEKAPANNHAVKGVRAVAAKANFTLTKKASRPVVEGGQKVGFTIALHNGATALTNAKVCDRLPAALVFVKAAGAAFVNGEACWREHYVAPHKILLLHLTARAVKGSVARQAKNVASATAANAKGVRKASATVRIKPVFGGAPGGVTG